MNIGYIGLGAMGGALAARLLESRPLHVFDVAPARLRAYAELGAVPMTSAADLARACAVVIICVPRSGDVRRVIFGESGLLEGLEPGKIVIDQTSGDPSETRQMAADLSARGVEMLDAPVSGGPRAAAAGTIAIMVGGAAEPYARVLPILQSISAQVTHCGPIGSGQVLKLLNNTISTCNRFAMLEAVAVGLKNGLSLSTMAEVLNSGGARSRATENLLPALVKGEQSATFALSLMLKDLNLATHLAIDSGAPLAFGQLARAMLQTASNAFGPTANLDDIAELVAVQAGTSFRLTPG